MKHYKLDIPNSSILRDYFGDFLMFRVYSDWTPENILFYGSVAPFQEVFDEDEKKEFELLLTMQLEREFNL